LLLALETSTKTCSVALWQNEQVLAERHLTSEAYIHSDKLHVFIQETLAEAQITPKDLTAIAVGKGPGSYTGLRIGAAAAKGLCFALNIPLFSANGAEILMQQAPLLEGANFSKDFFVPMLDARRQEVYQAIYKGSSLVKNLHAAVVNETSYGPYVKDAATVHLFGDGAPKFKELFATQTNIKVHPNIELRATDLARVAQQRQTLNKEEDVAYFEPFYLKDFVALKPKNPFF
jgi:tRNA threonylcarbamoyladenosine biosynthesis protein TsaB